MERLTHKNAKGEWCVKNNPQCAIATCSNDNGKYYIGQPIDRLAELEDKLESGRLIECRNEYNPKFAIYEDVYIIDYVDENNFSLRHDERNEKTEIIVRKCFVTDIIQHTRQGYAYWIQPHDCPKEILDDCTYHNEYWDKCWSESDLFKTKEQAEAKLEELNKKD